jgi:hypothetical protein
MAKRIDQALNYLQSGVLIAIVIIVNHMKGKEV